MDLVLDVLSWALILNGAVFAIIGGIGMLRLPDMFARMHGAGIIDTMGMISIFLGLALQAGFTMVTVKLVMIVLMVLYTGPTATHALARAALHAGVLPLLSERRAAPDTTDTDATDTREDA
ncbi:MAG: monovalent cation/H(+) antiporter subunit G [Rhodobacterales bacterium]|nr:monovalent cation/H(+) antiporter subunit G [Rhodobacterales bacterium]